MANRLRSKIALEWTLISPPELVQHHREALHLVGTDGEPPVSLSPGRTPKVLRTIGHDIFGIRRTPHDEPAGG